MIAITTLTVAYGAVAGLIGLTLQDYKTKQPTYLLRPYKVDVPVYNGIPLRSF